MPLPETTVPCNRDTSRAPRSLRNRAAPGYFVIAMFLVILACPSLLQIVIETRRGQWPQAFQVFLRRPTRDNLRAHEKALQEASVTVRSLRPVMQAAQFFLLQEAGEKALVGRDGWLFYQPGVSFLTQRARARDSRAGDAF